MSIDKASKARDVDATQGLADLIAMMSDSRKSRAKNLKLLDKYERDIKRVEVRDDLDEEDLLILGSWRRTVGYLKQVIAIDDRIIESCRRILNLSAELISVNRKLEEIR